jgi:hypothetical protein
VGRFFNPEPKQKSIDETGEFASYLSVFAGQSASEFFNNRDQVICVGAYVELIA